MLLDVILLVCSYSVQAYDLTSCDMSCDHIHVPLHYLKRRRKSKSKEKENQKKRNIKSRKIDKRKRKILVLTVVATTYHNDKW